MFYKFTKNFFAGKGIFHKLHQLILSVSGYFLYKKNTSQAEKKSAINDSKYNNLFNYLKNNKLKDFSNFCANLRHME